MDHEMESIIGVAGTIMLLCQRNEKATEGNSESLCHFEHPKE